jgi:hypothetical protein
VPAPLALPALDPHRVGPLLVLRLAMIVSMPDQSAGRLALGTPAGAETISLLFLIAILLWIQSKICYNGGG